MTKYRIRLKNGRVIGPFVKAQLFELKAKGHIAGDEEAQLFPIGEWLPIDSFDFYPELMDEDKTVVAPAESKEETFVIDLSKIRSQINEQAIEKMEDALPTQDPEIELTETVRMTPTEMKIELEVDNSPAPLLEFELDNEPYTVDRGDKTQINPIAQKELARLRKKETDEQERKRRDEARKLKEDEERKKREEEEKLKAQDDSTQVIRLDMIKSDLLETAEAEDEKIQLEAKVIKKKKDKEAKLLAYEEDEEDQGNGSNKKNLKLLAGLALIAIFYAVFFPSDDKGKNEGFQHRPVKVVFPIPFDKADSKRSEIEYEKGVGLFVEGTYPEIIKAGELLKSSYENNLDNEKALNLLVRSYAEQLQYSKNKILDAQTIFNLVQSKRPFLMNDPNGIIGMSLFYSSIEKDEAAVDVISKYLKLKPKDVTQDLFATYLKVLMKTGRLDTARQFHQALEKAAQKNRYTYAALIEYAALNQEMTQALEYASDAIKNNPKHVEFLLAKAELLIKEKKFDEIEALLKKAETLNLEHNDYYRARYLEVKGLYFAFKGNAKKATQLLTESLKIHDSDELRVKLAELNTSEDGTQSATDQLISESKAVKQLLLAKSFYQKKNYELAMSSAAKATDYHPGHIPSELFLAKVQLRLGLTDQGLKTLEELIKKYPDNKEVNLALVDAYIDTYKFNNAKNRLAIISATDIRNSPEFASANAKLSLQMGDSLHAISWFKNSITLNPLNDHDIYLLSEILIKKANFDAAMSLLNKAIELDPVNPDYRIAYSKIIYEKQDDQAAVGYLLDISGEFGENAKVLSEIAIFYYRAGKVKDFLAYKDKIEKLPYRDKALYEFMIRAALLDERYQEVPGLVEKLLEVEPGDLESMMTAGKVMFETGKLVEAAKWFKRVQQKLDTYPKVQYYIAKIKYLSNDLDGALAEVKKDLKDNGENDADLSLLAQIYLDKGEIVEAENTFKKAQKINPRSYEALMGLADISTKRNNFDLALDLYKKAMNEKMDEPLIHKKVGDVYRLLGQGALAIESYKLYLDMNPEASDKNQIQAYMNLMQ
jgi:tetratricopeptide (TPR) repeat protein